MKSARPSDACLLRAVAAERSSEAFAELFERHHATGYRLACQILNDSDLAAEAFQDAMLTVWTSAAACREATNPRAWLLRIVARKCLMLLRRRRLQRARAAASPRAVHDRRAEPGAQAEARECSGVLHALLGSLDAAERQLLDLYYGSDCSQDELAERLRLPQRTVSFRLQKSLAYLRSGMRRAGFVGQPVLE